MRQPHGAEHRVVALLAQEQLSIMAQAHVGFAVFVDIWCVAEGSAESVEVEGGTLSNYEENANIALASKTIFVSISRNLWSLSARQPVM